MPFTEDWTEFFDANEFGTEATFGGGSKVVGVFDQDYAEDLNIPGRQPRFVCPEASVTSLNVGDSITIGSTTYTVGEKQPVDAGLVELILRT